MSEEKEDVDEFSFFAPINNENQTLPIFLELLKYDEPLQFINEDFILKNADKLVKSQDDFLSYVLIWRPLQ